MSSKCSETDPTTEQENVDRIVCNSCSIEFENVEQLVQHTQYAHTEPSRGVTCGKCEIDFTDITEFLKHLRSVHLKESCGEEDEDEVEVKLENDVKCDEALNIQDAGTAETVQIENSIAEQITIVNGNGETIGIVTECDGDQVAAITAAHEAAQTLLPAATHIPPFTFQAEQPRKRRLPSKFRDMIVESSPVWKRMATEQSLQQHTADTANKDELEIDVTGLTGIKLKTKAYHEEDIMTYLSRVEEKLDCIIKHFNVPLNTDIAQRVTPDNTPKNKSLKKTSQQCALSNESSMMNNIAASLNMNHRASVNGHHEQDLGYVSSDSPQNVLEITQYVISEDLLNAVYMKSRNRGNFAKHLVFAAFPIEERLGRNCYGRRGGTVSGPKHPLENAKLEAVREAVFKKFPVLGGEEIDSVWKRECVIAIDTALRSEMRTHVLSMQNTIKREMTEILPADMKEGVKGSMAMNVTM